MWRVTQQSKDLHPVRATKAAAVALRVKITDTWRLKPGHTAVKHFSPQKTSWTEYDGYDLKDHGVVVDFVHIQKLL